MFEIINIELGMSISLRMGAKTSLSLSFRFRLITFGRSLSNLLEATLGHLFSILSFHAWVYLRRDENFSCWLITMMCLHDAHHIISRRNVVAKLSCINHADVCVLQKALRWLMVSLRVHTCLVDSREHAICIEILGSLMCHTLRIHFCIHFRHVWCQAVAHVLEGIIDLFRTNLWVAVTVHDAQFLSHRLIIYSFRHVAQWVTLFSFQA